VIVAIPAFRQQDRCDIAASAHLLGREQDPRPFARPRVSVMSMDEIRPGPARADGRGGRATRGGPPLAVRVPNFGLFG